MEQEDLIESIENNGGTESVLQEQNLANSNPNYNINPLPEDLGFKKKKMSFTETINLVSYIMLGIAALFMLILYIIGFLK